MSRSRVSILEGGFKACVQAFQQDGTLEQQLEGDLLQTIRDEEDDEDQEWSGPRINPTAREMAREGLALASENLRGVSESLRGARNLAKSYTEQVLSDGRVQKLAERSKSYTEKTKAYTENVLADERVQKMAEKTKENAQKTKEKAKSWGLKGFGLLSKAVSTVSAAASEVANEVKTGVEEAIRGDMPDDPVLRSSRDAEGAKFAIEEDEDEEGSSSDARSRSGSLGGGDMAGGEFEPDSLINLKHWRDRPQTVVTACKRLGPNSVCLDRHLVISKSLVMDLEVQPSKPNVAKLKACHALENLQSINVPPEDPEMLTLIFNIKGAAKPRGYVYLIEPDVRCQCLLLLKGEAAQESGAVAGMVLQTGDKIAIPVPSSGGVRLPGSRAGVAAAGEGVQKGRGGVATGGDTEGSLIDLLGVPGLSAQDGAAAAAPAAGMCVLCVCIYTCVYIHVCIYTRVYIYTCACMHVPNVGLRVLCASQCADLCCG
jgi:hypothetical protein